MQHFTETKRFYEILNDFEKNFGGMRFDKEEKSMWKKWIVYQDGNVNKMLKAFVAGYSFARHLSVMGELE